MLTLQSHVLSCKTLFFLALIMAIFCHFWTLVTGTSFNFLWKIVYMLHHIPLKLIFFKCSNISDNLSILFFLGGPSHPSAQILIDLLLGLLLRYHWGCPFAITLGLSFASYLCWIASFLRSQKFATTGTFSSVAVYSSVVSYKSSKPEFSCVFKCFYLPSYLTMKLSRRKIVVSKTFREWFLCFPGC